MSETYVRSYEKLKITISKDHISQAKDHISQAEPYVSENDNKKKH